jgi:gliding-associated putative ABC transporter substrate-binding component GldG
MKNIKSASLIATIFIFGILVMINFIGIRNFVRLDLTSAKIYSLSDGSKDIVSGIDGKVRVRAFFTPDLPSPHNTTERYLRDLLEDYKAFSKGHMDYEFIDPGSDEALEREASSFLIPSRQFQSVVNDKMEMKMGYMGVVVMYGDKRETIPFVGNVGNLEYEISSILNRLTSPALPKLGLALVGAEAKQLSIQQFYESIGQNFNVVPINLSEPIDSSVDGIFLISPRIPLTEWQLYNLDQYIMAGGKVALFSSSYEVDQQQSMFRQYSANLEGFLGNLGISIGKDILIDNRCGAVKIQDPSGFSRTQQMVQFPFMPSITLINTENSITRSLSQVQTYFPSSVDGSEAVSKGYEAEGLLYTSNFSGRSIGRTIPMQLLREWVRQDFKEKNIPVAIVVKGAFDSYFKNSGPPQKPEAGPGESGHVVRDTPYTGTFLPAATEENRIIVVGDGHMPLDSHLPGHDREILFIQNIADWLVQAESLISIRSKQVVTPPLANIPNLEKKLVKWANHFGPVILVICLGLILWQVRRYRKKALLILFTEGDGK